MHISNERDLDYSKPLDIHYSSNHPEATKLVDRIFNQYFAVTKPSSIKSYKKHLKTLLLHFQQEQ